MRPIYLARLDKTRPVLIMTRGSVSELRHMVTVAEISSTIRSLPTEVPVGRDHGLDHDSVVNLDAVLTIKKEMLIRRVGSLHDDQEPALRAAVVRAFDLED
jgi:mRNA interferase MazF